MELTGKAALRELPLQASQVASHEWLDVGVTDRRRGTLVLPNLRHNLGGDRDREPWELGADELGDRALMLGVAVGVQEADGDRLHVLIHQTRDLPSHRGQSGRLQWHAITAHALCYLDPPGAGHDRVLKP